MLCYIIYCIPDLFEIEFLIDGLPYVWPLGQLIRYADQKHRGPMDEFVTTSEGNVSVYVCIIIKSC